MLMRFELARHRRANVWLDETPPAEFTAASIATGLVKPRVVVEASRSIAAVELCIPHGPSGSYGLIGAALSNSDADGLEVVVSVNGAGSTFQPSIAVKPDDVKVGLLEEYAGAVTSGVVRIAESVGAPTGATLRFRWAAHGLVSSSPSMFEKASAMVVQLLTLPNDASEDQIRALLER